MIELQLNNSNDWLLFTLPNNQSIYIRLILRYFCNYWTITIYDQDKVQLTDETPLFANDNMFSYLIAFTKQYGRFICVTEDVDCELQEELNNKIFLRWEES